MGALGQLRGAPGTKNPAELGAAAPTVEVPAGLQVTPEPWGVPSCYAGACRAALAMLLTQVCRQGCTSAVGQGSTHGGCQHRSCICTQSSSICLAHGEAVSQEVRKQAQLPGLGSTHPISLLLTSLCRRQEVAQPWEKMPSPSLLCSPQ